MDNAASTGLTPLTPARRAVLVFAALLLVSACAYLSLGLSAVPQSELFVVVLSIIYVSAGNLLQRAPPIFKTSARLNCIRPLSMSGVFSRGTVRMLLSSSFVLSVLIPWTWLLFLRPSRSQRLLLAPHLFFMMVQILFEIWSYRVSVSSLVRLAIPVGFVAYRLRILAEWVRQAVALVYPGPESRLSDRLMLALSVANLLFWGFVLFYVLLLKVVPPYFADYMDPPKSPAAVEESRAPSL